MKHISTLLIAIFSLSGVYGQSLKAIFGKMPYELSGYIDSVKRQDLMDLYLANRTAVVKNNLNDSTTLGTFTDEYLQMTTGRSVLEIVLLPMVNDSKVICVIQTVCAPVCDSRISFYTTEWKQLETSIFLTPAGPEWFIKDDVDKSDPNFAEATLYLDINLMQFKYDPAAQTIYQIYNTPDYLDKKDRAKLEPFLRNTSKTFVWNKTHFKG